MKLKGKRCTAIDDRFILRRFHPYKEFPFFYMKKTLEGFEEQDILTQDVNEYVREKYRQVLRQVMGFPPENASLFFSSMNDRHKVVPLWPVKHRRKPCISTQDCALDLPGFKALFYNNLLDWGATGYFAAALRWSIFLCHPTTNKTIHLTDIDSDNPVPSRADGGEFGTAIKWDTEGKNLAIGTNKSNIQIWRTKEKKLEVDTWCTCVFRRDCTITSFIWSDDNKYLVCGCSSGKLSLVQTPDNRFGDFRTAHDGKINILSSSPDGKYLASAGNDNAVRLWRWPQLSPHFEILYDYPARAITWHPWKCSLLAIGGGFEHGAISVYNVNNCTRIAKSTPRTRGIVLSLAWSSITGELVASYWVTEDSDLSSGQGFSEILVLSNLNQVVDKFMSGYQTQVTYLLWSPDGKKMATASTDETLRIWNFIHFEEDKDTVTNRKKRSSLHPEMCRSLNASFSKYAVR